jgi:hypothetical protein
MCVNAKPVIDNKPPKFKISMYYNKVKLNQDEYMARINFKHNMALMKAINLVSRHGVSNQFIFI